MQTRRTFIKTAFTTGILTGTGTFPWQLLNAEPEQYFKLTVLHTNDVHSRIEPFPNGTYAGLGGSAKRAAMIQQIRREEEHVLLLDAGDIFQGTPYFNLFDGEVDFKLMNYMGYDVATIGNHDFDAGMEALKKQVKTATFPMVSANYNFTNTIMDGYTKPYHIIRKGKLKIGIFGLGIELEGLVPANLYDKTLYLDPITKAKETAHLLKNKEACHLVICLSHLGYRYEGEDLVSDEILAQQTANIDLIIGGHTHTFMDKPAIYSNAEGKEVMVNQAGWAGIMLGRVDFYFRRDRKKRQAGSKALKVK